MSRVGLVALVLLMSSAGVYLHAEEWAPFEGAEQLRELVAGATAEIEMKPGHVAVGQYRADGTATITAWGETYERTWEVGVAKTTMIGGRPWKFNLQYWHYVVAPDTFGPNHQIRIGISPVVELPW